MLWSDNSGLAAHRRHVPNTCNARKLWCNLHLIAPNSNNCQFSGQNYGASMRYSRPLTWRIFMSTASSLLESVASKRQRVTECAIALIAAWPPELSTRTKSYSRNLEIDESAALVIGPDVSADSIT